MPIMMILNVDEIGEKIAMSLKQYFGMSSNIRLIERLKKSSTKFFYQNENDKSGNSLKNLSFVVTGTFENISRDKLKHIM